MTDFAVPVRRQHVTVLLGGTLPTLPHILICWDRETGWGHIATHDAGSPLPRFVAFHHFPSGDARAVRAEFLDAGYQVLSERDLGDGLLEARLELVAKVKR